MDTIAADQLIEDLDRALADNQRFIADLDTAISRANLQKEQMERNEAIGYLQLAKKSLETNPPSNTGRYFNARPRN
jgi:hypothetical protein